MGHVERIGDSDKPDEWADMIAAGEITPADSNVDIRDIEPVP